MRKWISFALLLATAVAWFSVVAPAQDKSTSDSSETASASAPAKDTKAAKPDDKVGDEVSALADDGAKQLSSALRGALSDAANDAMATTGMQREIRHFLSFHIGPFTSGDLLASFTILLLAMILRNVLTRMLFRHLKFWAKKTHFQHDDQLLDTIEKPVSIFLLVFGVHLAILALPIEPMIDGLLENLFRGGSMLIVVWGMVRATDVLTNALSESCERRNSALHGFIPTINKSAKIFIVIVGVLLVIDNLGYNVSGILATLGLGGAAIAFASQDTIKNLFGTFMIMLDRPFKVGDWIIVGDKVDGDVEAIGLRSTKVRTWPKTVLSIPNGVLANEYINNWSRMPKRRVKQVVGISYEATADDMEALVEDVREILRTDEGVNQEFILVNFTDFGSSSLDILVYYFTLSTKWLEYMDVRQRVNCKIMRAIQQRGLSVAFPTRTLYLDGQVARHMAQVDYENRWESQARRGGVGGAKPADTGVDPARPPGQLGGGEQGEGRLPGDWGPDLPL